MKNGTILTITKLKKSYGIRKKVPDKIILNCIDMRLKKGQCICIVGENGAGKSTLLKIVMGLIPQDSGDIEILGNTGYVPETSINFRYLSAAENLDYYAQISGNSTDYGELMNQLGIGDTKKKSLKNFSKGMARKIDIVRALNTEPALIVLDEPFEGLDPKTCTDIIETLKEAKNAGKAILMSSHDMSYVERIADEVMLLENGKIKEISKAGKGFCIIFESDNTSSIESNVKKYGVEVKTYEGKYIININDESLKNDIIRILIDSGASIVKQGYRSLEEEYLDEIS